MANILAAVGVVLMLAGTFLIVWDQRKTRFKPRLSDNARGLIFVAIGAILQIVAIFL